MFFKDKINKLKLECEKEYEIQKDLTACSTGYRPQKCPWGFNEQDIRCVNMRHNTKEKVEFSIKNGYQIFISGMALGFDMIFAEIVLELKEKYPHIKLIAALPCKDQYKFWASDQIKRYKYILSLCDNVRCLYDKYNDKCMLERNEYMLKNSSKVIALFDGLAGGTKSTILKAKKMGLTVEIIKP